MSVRLWYPPRQVEELQGLLRQYFETPRNEADRPCGFPVDICETPTEVIVRADLPGVISADIQVQHHDGQLLIRAVRKAQPPEGCAWLMHQTPEGDLVRVFTLGVPVDLDGVEAVYEAGVLELHLQKAVDARPRTIPVKAALPEGRKSAGRPAPKAASVAGAGSAQEPKGQSAAV